MAVEATGTNGGWRGLNGAQRRILLLFLGGFLSVIVLILVANAESQISDLESSGAHIPAHLVWSWEWSSMIGWLSIYPALWWAVARLKPPATGWPMAILFFSSGTFLASGWHIGMMVGIRHVYYAATGNGPYRFFGIITDRLIYEYRKDVTTYVQFVAIAAIVQWLLSRSADAEDSVEAGRRRSILEIVDGPVRHAVPVVEIEAIRSAGNYVEVEWAGRKLLHRATLTAVATELGDDFVRIHRGQIVRRDAVRQLRTERSGDFVVTLTGGLQARGSRRYRNSLR